MVKPNLEKGRRAEYVLDLIATFSMVFQIELKFEDYPVKTQKIFFLHEGQDRQFWKGHYGSKMAGGVVKFLFDSIEPTEEDVDYEEN